MSVYIKYNIYTIYILCDHSSSACDDARLPGVHKALALGDVDLQSHPEASRHTNLDPQSRYK